VFRPPVLVPRLATFPPTIDVLFVFSELGSGSPPGTFRGSGFSRFRFGISMGEPYSGLHRSNGFLTRRGDSSHMSRRLGELSNSRPGDGYHRGLAGKKGAGVSSQSGNERDSNGGGINVGSDGHGERIT
jgi:hypothetical protein